MGGVFGRNREVSAYRNLAGNMKVRDCLKELRGDGRTILKRIV
jgi:hypothetical protein